MPCKVRRIAVQGSKYGVCVIVCPYIQRIQMIIEPGFSLMRSHMDQPAKWINEFLNSPKKRGQSVCVLDAGRRGSQEEGTYLD